jgi:NaMN:DMB phosphoribosyltransferase
MTAATSQRAARVLKIRYLWGSVRLEPDQSPALDQSPAVGSRAALALPIVAAAARALRDVATFDSAGVSGAKE